MLYKKKLILVVISFMIIANSVFGENLNGIVKKDIRVLTIEENEVKLDTVRIKHIKTIHKYVFPIGRDINSFGYHYYPETGEISSVECIRVIKNSIYLIDQVHKNIKKINLMDGVMSVSKSLKRDRTYLSSMGYLNNSLYIFSDFNTIFKLDLDLEFKNLIFLKDYNGEIYVYSENEDKLIFYSLYTFSLEGNGNDLVKSDDITKTLFMNIDKNGDCKPYYLAKELVGSKNLLQTPQEKAGYEIKFKGKLYFQTNNFAYEIPESFKNLNDYSCLDVDYSDKYVVRFKTNNKRVEIMVCEY